MTALRSTALAAAFLLAALPAFAQGGPGGGPMTGGHGMMPMSGMMAQGGFGHVEGRLAYLKTELKITAAQTPQWTAFAEAVRANAQAMMDRHGVMMSGMGAAQTLPERLALEQQAMTANLEAMKKSATALSALYDALSPEQKTTADEIIIGPMGMPMGMM
jgi:hypothetical protein